MGNVERREFHAVRQELCIEDWKGKAEDRLNICRDTGRTSKRLMAPYTLK